MSHFFTVVHMVWIRRETEEAELFLSTVLHGRLGSHEEKGKEMSAGDEDIRQLKEDVYEEEEGRDTRARPKK